MNPNHELDRNRLFRAVEGSYRVLEPFRNLTRGLVEEYAGNGYGRAERPRREIMLNVMNQAVDAYTMALVANRPKCLASTRYPELSYFAKQFQVAINNLCEEICIDQTLRQWVLDAFFCLGIIKVHMADSGPVMLEQGVWMDPGTPFASNVSIDNWVHDAGATRYDQVKFAGEMYRMPFEDLKTEVYDQAAVRDLLPTSKHPVDAERMERIGAGYDTDFDELEPMIDLADLWVPRDGKIYTFAIDARQHFRPKGKPVAVMDWNGPEFGPYHLLGFNDVPENIMPTSPASHLSSLARLLNNLMRKQSTRAKNAKRAHTYTPAGAEAAQQLQRSNDDAWVQVQDNSQIGVVESGGIDPANQQFMLNTLDMFDRMAGNLTAMLGLGAQADTASQEQLIHGAVSKKEAQMQTRVTAGVKRLLRDLGHMLWHDRVKSIPGQIPVDGAPGYSVDASWTPEDREGDFFDYNIDLDVYSMAYQSPAQRMNVLNQLLTQQYIPAQQSIMQAGGMLDWMEIIDTQAELLNEPRIKNWIKFTSIAASPEPGPQGMGKAPTTTRNYVRRSAGGGQGQGKNVQQQQFWAGMANRGLNAQPSAV